MTRAPDYLLARLSTLQAHVRHLARSRGLEDAFLGELASLDQKAEQAFEARSREMVEAVLSEMRAFARAVGATERDAARFAEHGRITTAERTSILLTHGEGKQA